MRKKLISVLQSILLCILYSWGGYVCAEQDASKFYLPNDITQAQAEQVMAAAVKKAVDNKLLMNIAIVDAGGNLKAFVRMDGAFLASIDIAIKKAKTARSLNMSTYELSKLAQPGNELYGIEATNGGMAIFGGGELIKNKDGLIVGAIGVSGGSVAEDMTVAQAGAAVMVK
ncbi:heme-binding protein [Entomomonas sp. E2T0]|uniref:GlcG/HbpS family heme-binding protein n=1 Tax=Entomomonas sp. E2T0 TaxID=2930213 RepID=UPI0022283EB7|nr:heme-binding protein [Entomomonas sp. E2T0]UYZ84197.1 heme-binding protein [Entomomonas sp. E2T0]